MVLKHFGVSCWCNRGIYRECWECWIGLCRAVSGRGGAGAGAGAWAWAAHRCSSSGPIAFDRGPVISFEYDIHPSRRLWRKTTSGRGKAEIHLLMCWVTIDGLNVALMIEHGLGLEQIFEISFMIRYVVSRWRLMICRRLTLARDLTRVKSCVVISEL